MATFTASCSATGPNTASFKATFSGGDSSFIGYRCVRFYIEDFDTYIIRVYTSRSSSTSFSKSVSGLSPNTTYFWAARLGYETSTGTVWLDLTDSGTFRTESSTPTVDKWSWTSSNGSATATQTRNAQSAVANKGSLSNFSYLVWNDMVNKVNECLVATGHSWTNLFGNLSNTRMSASNKNMTSNRFNSVRENLGKYHNFSTWIPYVSSGDIVYGSYFLNIATEINRWIDEM